MYGVVQIKSAISLRCADRGAAWSRGRSRRLLVPLSCFACFAQRGPVGKLWSCPARACHRTRPCAYRGMRELDSAFARPLVAKKNAAAPPFGKC